MDWWNSLNSERKLVVLLAAGVPLGFLLSDGVRFMIPFAMGAGGALFLSALWRQSGGTSDDDTDAE